MRVTARRATRRRGVRALKRERERRSGRQAFVRVETCGRCGHGRRCYVNSHVGSDAIKSCNAFFARTSIDSQVYARVFFCVFYTRANSLRIPGTSARHKFSRPKRAANPFPRASPFEARRVARLRSRRAGTGRLPGGGRVSRSREPRFRARDRAHPPIAARGVLVLPSRDRGTAAQSPPLPSADARCVRVGATKWRAAPPPKRCDTERPSAVARPHPRLATRAPSRPRDARRRCPDSIRPPNGSPRRPNVSTSKEVEEFRARETPRP